MAKVLDRPGNQDIQLALFPDYGTNVPENPQWQALLRPHQPPAPLMSGRNDPIFPETRAHPCKRGLNDLGIHILDTGHFALEEFGAQRTQRMLAVLDRITR